MCNIYIYKAVLQFNIGPLIVLRHSRTEYKLNYTCVCPVAELSVLDWTHKDTGYNAGIMETGSIPALLSIANSVSKVAGTTQCIAAAS